MPNTRHTCVACTTACSGVFVSFNISIIPHSCPIVALAERGPAKKDSRTLDPPRRGYLPLKTTIADIFPSRSAKGGFTAAELELNWTDFSDRCRDGMSLDQMYNIRGQGHPGNCHLKRQKFPRLAYKIPENNCYQSSSSRAY